MNAYAEFLHGELKRHPAASLPDAQEVEPFRHQLRERLLRQVLRVGPRVSLPRGIVVDETRLADFRREKLLIECEPGSWQTALLYLPVKPQVGPGILLACGHGGSKAHGYNQLAAQLYAQMGCAVIVTDPLGEEERHEPYGLGLRGHRHGYVVDRMNEAGRPFLGKVVADLLVAFDYLAQRPEVDATRLGCAGSSMGGTLVQWLVAVEPRLRAAVLSSWAADDRCLDGTIGCCYRLPGAIREAGQLELMALAAPECALLVGSGREDEVTPPYGLEAMGERLSRWWRQLGAPERFACQLEAGGGHRPYHLTLSGLVWMARHLRLPCLAALQTAPTTTLGEVCRAAGYSVEPMYRHERHHQGTRIPAWPLEFEPPEKLRVLDEATLRLVSLERRAFTLSGYLELKGIPPLHPLAPLPSGWSTAPEAAAERVRKTLDSLAPKPAWRDEPLPAPVTEKNGGVGYPLGFAEAKLRVSPSAREGGEGVLVLTRGTAEPLASAGMCCATVDLVAFNDHETSLGLPSLFFNLHLVQRACAILRRECPQVSRWRLESWVPRLGELVFFGEPGFDALFIFCRQAVERAGAGIGRAENIVPDAAGRLHWVDLLYAVAPRSLFLHPSYLSPQAAEPLRQYLSFLK
ncbi:MAG TPA: prolyl oligopeptidase family serine peptidase [Chthoniobacteraceae bacterium]|nr:prolyl oligopeptidase family serine peptidase [Chthoniobacteraceae bacterium]